MPVIKFQNRRSGIERELLLRGAVELNRTPGVDSPNELIVLPWPFGESDPAQQIQVRKLRDEIWHATDFTQYFFLLVMDEQGDAIENGRINKSIEYQAIGRKVLLINSKHGNNPGNV